MKETRENTKEYAKWRWICRYDIVVLNSFKQPIGKSIFGGNSKIYFKFKKENCSLVEFIASS